MIRVTFDRDYIDTLQDFYHRNKCIREQQYLSQEKLLHLAAFCLSKVAIELNKGGETHRNGPKAEAALDAIRQLSILCESANQASAGIGPTTVVRGHTDGERQDLEQHTPTPVSPALVEKSTLHRLWAAVGSAMRGRGRSAQYPL